MNAIKNLSNIHAPHVCGNRRGHKHGSEKCMSVNRLPTGVAVAQAKKDAKRLANESEIPLSHAQNEIALKHGRADWPTLMNQLKTQSTLSVTLKQSFLNHASLDFPENKSLNIVVGQSGSGKTLLLLEFAAQWLQKGFPVVYLGADVSQGYQGGAATNSLISKYPSLFTALPFQSLTKGFVLDDLMLNGAILIIDELPFMLANEMVGIRVEQVQRLVNCSMHTFLSYQVLDEAVALIGLLKISNDSMRFLVLKAYVNDVRDNMLVAFEEKVLRSVEHLKYQPDKFTEFLYVAQEGYQKYRFSLADHHALKD